VAAGESGGTFALARYEPDGTPDPSFGGGSVTVPVSAGGDEARGVAVEPDGEVVAVGTADGRSLFAVVRTETDGDPDPTFGVGGVATLDISGGFDVANGVALQPDGKIVVAGSAGTNRPRFVVARLLTDGTPDPAFGTDGIVRTPFGIWGVARAVAIQDDGSIVVAGGNGRGWALARYTDDGGLDPTFEGDGKVTAPLFGDAFALTVQPDDRIVAAGAYDFYRFAVARFTRRGHLDRTFSDDGLRTTDVGYGSEQIATGVAVQHDGRIVVTGTAGPHEFVEPIAPRFALVRYRANGAIDPSFGGDGRVTTRFAGGAHATGAARTGRTLVVVGGTGAGFALARYLL
jgi:uncharacterized delta-60 repeat protein